MNGAFAWYSDPMMHDAQRCDVCAGSPTSYHDCSVCLGSITADCSSCKHRLFEENRREEHERELSEADMTESDTDPDMDDAMFALQVIDRAVWIAVGVATLTCLAILTAVVVREAVKSG